MKISNIGNEFFLVRDNWTSDIELNIAIDNIIDAYEEFEDEEFDDESLEVLADVWKEYLGTDFATDFEGKLIALAQTEDGEKVFEIWELLDDLGVFDEDGDDDNRADIEESIVCEALKKKIIVRKGKRLKVKRSTRKGYTTRGGKEVRMPAGERRKRKISQRKGAKKRRVKMKRAVRKRKKSLKKRKAMGIK